MIDSHTIRLVPLVSDGIRSKGPDAVALSALSPPIFFFRQFLTVQSQWSIYERVTTVHSNLFFFNVVQQLQPIFWDIQVIKLYDFSSPGNWWQHTLCANGNAKSQKKDAGCQHLRNGDLFEALKICNLHTIFFGVFPSYSTSHPNMIPLFSTDRDSNTMNGIASAHPMGWTSGHTWITWYASQESQMDDRLG